MKIKSLCVVLMWTLLLLTDQHNGMMLPR